MNIVGYNIAFVSAIVCLTLGIYVIAGDRRDTRRRIFFLICVFLAILNLDSIPAYTSDARREVLNWSQIASIAVNGFYALNLHFYLNLIKKRIPVWVIPLVYLLPLVVVIAYAVDPLLFLDYHRYGGQWKLYPNYGSPWFYYSAGLCVAYVVFSVTAIIVFMSQAESRKEKLQAKLLIANLCLSTLIGVLGLWVIPYFDFRIPNVGPTYHFPYVLGLFFSVFFFKFLDMKPAIVADEIISNISDMVLLLGPDFRVLSANSAFMEILSYGAGDLAGKKFADLAYVQDDKPAGIGRIRSDETRSMRLPLSYRRHGKGESEPVMTETYISKIIDRFGDIIGFLVISRINGGRKQFQAVYGITDREYEIADLTLAGLTSAEIGRRLGLSARTVQKHQEHIYQKMGVAGKVELINIAHRFNLAPLG